MNGRAVALAAVVLAAGCGGNGTMSAAELEACVAKKLPPGAVDRVLVTTEEGVTSFVYLHRGSETSVTVFATPGTADAAERAEARLGDAHDRRTRNVLHSGGGVVEDAVVACLA
jgi:hypothetical protein